MEIPPGGGAPVGGYYPCQWPIRGSSARKGRRRYVKESKEVPFYHRYTKGVLLLSRMVQYKGKWVKGLDLEAELPLLKLC